MNKLLPLRRIAAGVSLSLLALASVAGLSGCDRRQSEVPMPSPGGGSGQSMPGGGAQPMPGGGSGSSGTGSSGQSMPSPMPDATPTSPRQPASAASR